MAFSKMFKDGFEWRKARIDDEQVETFRKEMIAADIGLFGHMLAEVKRKLPNLHSLSQERIALAIFEKKANSFYTDVQNLLDEMIEAVRMASAKRTIK